MRLKNEKDHKDNLKLTLELTLDVKCSIFTNMVVMFAPSKMECKIMYNGMMDFVGKNKTCHGHGYKT